MLISIGEQEFAQEVIQSTDPVLVSFWAPWCQLCRLIEPMLYHWQSTAAPGVKLVRINADENFNLARGYQLKSIPALLLFQNGELRGRLAPTGDRQRLQAALHQLLHELPLPLS